MRVRLPPTGPDIGDGMKETTLCKLAVKYKCDKAPSIHHSYTPYYSKLFKGKIVKKVLEIGIAAGASLYMWEEYFPQAQIFGLDCNETAMINKGRIKSFLYDQEDIHLAPDVAKSLGKDFDLIVDDGSHQTGHQITSAQELIPLLSKDGIYIIEDVYQHTHIQQLLNYKCEIVEFNTDTIHDNRLVIIHAKSQSRYLRSG